MRGMRELSLHILDIMQNSISAGASRIVVSANADTAKDLLTIRIEDDGRGMDPEFAERIRDPFVTTRTVRKVGLGIPMLAAAAEACDGSVSVRSQIGKGTVVEAAFGFGHIDRAPMGDIVGTMISAIVANPELSFRYEQQVDGRDFVLDTDEVKAQLDDVPISEPAVVGWIRDYMTEGISVIGKIT